MNRRNFVAAVAAMVAAPALPFGQSVAAPSQFRATVLVFDKPNRNGRLYVSNLFVPPPELPVQHESSYVCGFVGDKPLLGFAKNPEVRDGELSYEIFPLDPQKFAGLTPRTAGTGKVGPAESSPDGLHRRVTNFQLTAIMLTAYPA